MMFSTLNDRFRGFQIYFTLKRSFFEILDRFIFQDLGETALYLDACTRVILLNFVHTDDYTYTTYSIQFINRIYRLK